MVHTIQLFNQLTFDSERATTEVWAFVGRRGAGKSYACGAFVEELLRTCHQVIVIDVVGTWWGLRVGADGDPTGGYRIPVLGGGHADVDIVEAGGVAIARMLVETSSSAVIDLSAFRKGERQRFMTEWAEEFFHGKKRERSPVHVVIEEAHTMLPQRIHRGQERMFGALEDLVRLGRNYGIGISMLDQRPQSVNKEVLNQAEVLCAFQLVGAQERDAIKRWAEAKEAVASLVDNAYAPFADLSRLPSGECIVWSPGWLKTCQRVKVVKKRTFDASATPGTVASKVKAMRPIDLDELRKAMESASDKDPKIRTVSGKDLSALAARNEEVARLTRENEALKRELADAARRLAELVTQTNVVIASIRTDLDQLEPVAHARTQPLEAALQVAQHGMKSAFEPAKYGPATIKTFKIDNVVVDRGGKVAITSSASHPYSEHDGDGPCAACGPSAMSRMAGAFLTCLAQHADLTDQLLTKKQVLTLTGYRLSGDVSKCWADLKRREWISVEDRVCITGPGRIALGEYTPLPRGDALYRHLMDAAGGLATMERKLLTAIWNSHHAGVPSIAKHDILRIAGYKQSGDVSKAFAKLATLGYVIKHGRGHLRISGLLVGQGDA